MKVLYTKYLFSLLLFGFVFSGCKKYEEGPTISPWTKKARITNNWKVKEVWSGGSPMSGQFVPDGYTIRIWPDFFVTETWDSGSTEGTWHWGKGKEMVVIYATSFATYSPMSSTYDITRLKSNELWLSSGSLEYRLVPAK